jgi:hypothetical protein
MQFEMKVTLFQRDILARLYSEFELRGYTATINNDQINELAKPYDPESSGVVDAQIRQLLDVGLIAPDDSYHYRCTHTGITTIENNFPNEKVYENNKVRRLLLLKIYQARSQPNGHIDSDELYASPELQIASRNAIYNNAEFLDRQGVIEMHIQSGGSFFARILDIDLLNDSARLASAYPTSSNERISLDTITDVVRGWVPRQNRHYEEAYKAELSEYLRSQGYTKTREEEGTSRADILVDEVLPIELKLNPPKSELDRMSGQLLDMVAEYGNVIACVIQTKGSLDLLERVQARFKDSPNVRIVVKGG